MTLMVVLIIIPLVGLFVVLSIGPDLFQETEDCTIVQKNNGRAG